MTHTSPEHAPRVLVDSGTDPDDIRTYYELPQTLADRLRALVSDDDTIAQAIQQFLDGRETLVDHYVEMVAQRDAARAERDAALEAATQPDPTGSPA